MDANFGEHHSMSPSTPNPEPTAHIADLIRTYRGLRILVDSDLAALYGVTTTRLNQQFRRNRDRFPADFALEIEPKDAQNLMLQTATSSSGYGGRRKPLVLYTEHGAIMAATILNSPRAVQMTVYVVRAFVRLRQLTVSHAALAKELEALKRTVVALDADTKKQFDVVYEAILGLMAPRTGKQ